MMEIIVTGIQGLAAGQRFQLVNLPVGVGRDPGPGGILVPSAESTASRLHAEIQLVDGKPYLRNLSPNGILVDGHLVKESILLRRGARFSFGGEVAYRVDWKASQEPLAGGDVPLFRRRPVQLALAGYLVGLGVLGFGLSSASLGDPLVELEAATKAYREHRAATIGAADEARIAVVQRLVFEAEASHRSGHRSEAIRAYERALALEGDPGSPIYRFLAGQLVALREAHG